MNVCYCRVEDKEKVAGLIESGRFIPTQENRRYIYGKCVVGDCDFCERLDRNNYREYYTLEYIEEDEDSNQKTITFEPKFLGEE